MAQKTRHELTHRENEKEPKPLQIKGNGKSLLLLPYIFHFSSC